MRRSILLALSLAVFAVPAPSRSAQPAPADSVPAQQTIPRIGTFNGLATILNFGRGAVRVLAVVSPSSPDADRGLAVVQELLGDIPSKRLRAYVVLSRARDEDTQLRALDLASRHRDRRIVYMWDPAGITAAALAPVIGDTGARADDVYFLFDTAATFTTDPAAPVMWMHLNPALEGEPLDGAALRERAAGLVRAVERKASDAAIKGE